MSTSMETMMNGMMKLVGAAMMMNSKATSEDVPITFLKQGAEERQPKRANLAVTRPESRAGSHQATARPQLRTSKADTDSEREDGEDVEREGGDLEEPSADAARDVDQQVAKIQAGMAQRAKEKKQRRKRKRKQRRKQ